MTKAQYHDYNIKKNRIIKTIMDIYEFKMDYERIELVLMYNELKHKPLKYLIWYYKKLVQNF